MKKGITKQIMAVLFIVIATLGMTINCYAEELSDKNAVTVDTSCSGVVRIVGSSGSSFSSGTGFAVGIAGKETDIFVTNWHVVTDDNGNICDNVYILLNNNAVVKNGKYWDFNEEHMVSCKVLKTTTGYPDYAILKADRVIEGRYALTLMKSEQAQRAEAVYALGYPGSSDLANGDSFLYSMVEDVTVTTGALSRFTVMNIAGDTKIIQHNAQINHGNSGGPLINSDGYVIGINTYGFGDYEMEHSAAVYIDYAMEALDELGIMYSCVGKNDVPASSDTDNEEDKSSDNDVKWILVGGAVVILIAAALLVVNPKNTKSKGMIKSTGVLQDNVVEKNPSLKNPPQDGKVLNVPRANSSVDSGWRLQGISGNFEKRRFAINGEITIGRNASESGLSYPANAPGISGNHCVIGLRNGQVYIRDLNSTYGTYVNGMRIMPNQDIPLQLGAKITLAKADGVECFVIAKSEK